MVNKKFFLVITSFLTVVLSIHPSSNIAHCMLPNGMELLYRVSDVQIEYPVTTSYGKVRYREEGKEESYTSAISSNKEERYEKYKQEACRITTPNRTSYYTFSKSEESKELFEKLEALFKECLAQQVKKSK